VFVIGYVLIQIFASTALGAVQGFRSISAASVRSSNAIIMPTCNASSYLCRADRRMTRASMIDVLARITSDSAQGINEAGLLLRNALRKAAAAVIT